MANSNHTIRDDYWDTVKALLIFLVIFGHMIQFFMYHGETADDFWTDPVFKGIYLFHMPLFMMVSGYFAARSVKKYTWNAIPRYLQRLALPCLGMGCLSYIISAIQGAPSVSALLKGGAALWFLIVVFECLVWYLIMQQYKTWWYKLVILIIPILIAIYIRSYPGLSLCWPNAHQFTYLWPMFVLGTVLSSFNFTHSKINIKWIVFIPLFLPMYFIFQPTWYVYRLSLGFDINSILINLFRTLTAIIGCGAFLWIAKYLYPVISKYTITKNMGQATMAVYVLQTLFFEKIHCDFLKTSHYGYALLQSILLLLLLYFIYLVTRRIPLVSLLMYGEKQSAR